MHNVHCGTYSAYCTRCVSLPEPKLSTLIESPYYAPCAAPRPRYDVMLHLCPAMGVTACISLPSVERAGSGGQATHIRIWPRSHGVLGRMTPLRT